jgi:hypothetical protein
VRLFKSLCVKSDQIAFDIERFYVNERSNDLLRAENEFAIFRYR